MKEKTGGKRATEQAVESRYEGIRAGAKDSGTRYFKEEICTVM